MAAAEAAAKAASEAEQQYTRHVQQLQEQLQLSQAAQARAEEELRAVQQRQQQREAAMCERGVQAGSGHAVGEAAVQTEAACPPVGLSPSRGPMSARELQQELARICITPSRLPGVVRRAAPLQGEPYPPLPPPRPSPPPPLPTALAQPLPPSPIGSAAGFAASRSPSGSAAARSPAGSVYGTPAGTPELQPAGPTPAGATLQEALPFEAAVPLANISAHPTFEAEAAAWRDGACGDDDDWSRCACCPGARCALVAAAPWLFGGAGLNLCFEGTHLLTNPLLCLAAGAPHRR